MPLEELHKLIDLAKIDHELLMKAFHGVTRLCLNTGSMRVSDLRDLD